MWSRTNFTFSFLAVAAAPADQSSAADTAAALGPALANLSPTYLVPPQTIPQVPTQPVLAAQPQAHHQQMASAAPVHSMPDTIGMEEIWDDI